MVLAFVVAVLHSLYSNLRYGPVVCLKLTIFLTYDDGWWDLWVKNRKNWKIKVGKVCVDDGILLLRIEWQHFDPISQKNMKVARRGKIWWENVKDFFSFPLFNLLFDNNTLDEIFFPWWWFLCHSHSHIRTHCFKVFPCRVFFFVWCFRAKKMVGSLVIYLYFRPHFFILFSALTIIIKIIILIPCGEGTQVYAAQTYKYKRINLSMNFWTSKEKERRKENVELILHTYTHSYVFSISQNLWWFNIICMSSLSIENDVFLILTLTHSLFLAQMYASVVMMLFCFCFA